jgi:hypothetical protein
MSIFVRIRVEGKGKYFPLVTADTFKRFWLPGANALNLHWVKQFNACQLRPDNRVAICDELRQLKNGFTRLNRVTQPWLFQKVSTRPFQQLIRLPGKWIFPSG